MIQNRYLMNDSIPWLIDGKNPAVTYLAKKEILKITDEDQIYQNLVDSELTAYFSKNTFNGILGDVKHLDLVYRGSVWFFLLAAESGYKASLKIISDTAEMICNRTQTNTGGFSYYSRTPEAVGCRSGNMIYAMLKCGLSGSHTSDGIEWIVKHQRKDGGWLHCPVAGFCDVMKLVFFNKPGNGLRYETDYSIPSCPIASFTCLRALVQYGSNSYIKNISDGADFFIRNNFFYSFNGKLFCGNRVDFKKTGYPVMAQYDYLSGLILVAGIKKHGLSELFNYTIKKQNPDGTWNNENSLPGMIIEKSGKSRWTTLNALRLIFNTPD